MADISKITIESGTYDVKDVIARGQVEDFVFYAFFDKLNNNEISFFVSKDNIHLKKINTTNKIYGRDPSLIYINGKFLVAITAHNNTHDFVILESSDLENWTRHEINVGLYDPTYTSRVAPDFFLDDNNELYVIISKAYAVVDNHTKYKPYITKCTSINTLTFNLATEIILNDPLSDNHIDGTCIKKDNTYYLLMKNESLTGMTIQLYKSMDLSTWTKQAEDYANFGKYVEGCYVYKFKNKFYVGVERYTERDMISNYYLVKESDDLTNFSNSEYITNDEVNLSHGSAIVVTDEKAKNIIIHKDGYNYLYNYNFSLGKKTNYMSTFTTYENSVLRGNYLKLFSVKPKQDYKSFSIIFHIYDGYRNYINSLIEVNGTWNTHAPLANTHVSNRQISMTLEDYFNYKYNNLFGKIISIPNVNNGCYDVYLDLTTFTNTLNIFINFISYNVNDEDIIIYSESFVNTLPTTVASSILAAPRTKNESMLGTNLYIDNGTNNTLTFKVALPNSTIKIYGHANGVTEATTIDYDLHLLNGNIGAVNRVADSTINLTFTVVSYTDNIYTIRITGIPNYSGFNITLPPYLFGSILDSTLSNS